MKGWRIYAPRDMRLDELPMPLAKPGWVVVKIKVVQLSVTEVIWFTGGVTRGSEGFTKELQTKAPVQLMGHEYSGEVVEVGEGVTELKAGDRVAAVAATEPCNVCSYCLTGSPAQCKSKSLVGQHFPGALAEFAVLPASVLIRISEDVSYNVGACIQSMTSCLSAVNTACIEKSDRVAVLGQGAMGLGVMQIARISNPRKIITTDCKEPNLDLSRQLGADDVVNVNDTDPVEAVLQFTDGQGADIVFEAAGGSKAEGLSGTATFHQACQMVKTGGKIIQVASLGPSLEINPSAMATKSIQYTFPSSASLLTSPQKEYMVNLLATQSVQVNQAITHILHGIDEVPQAIEITGNKSQYGAINPAQVVIST